MKFGIHITPEGTQIVLTPETEWEKMATKDLVKFHTAATIFRGSYYNCQGGWLREGTDTDCLMIVLGKEAQSPSELL